MNLNRFNVPPGISCTKSLMTILSDQPGQIAMEDSDIERNHLPKRRRINGNDGRYSSPDELAASSDHEVSYHQRTNSVPHRDPVEQHQRRSYDDSSEDSPDELDHTIHTFYRDGWSRSQRPSRDAPSIDSPMITPRMATPPIEPPSYLPYRQKMVLKGHRRGVAAVRFSPDGRSIASCCEYPLLFPGGE